MEELSTTVWLVLIAFGILQIMLFFKIWGMTDDVKKLTQHFCKEDFWDSHKGSLKLNSNIGKTPNKYPRTIIAIIIGLVILIFLVILGIS